MGATTGSFGGAFTGRSAAPADPMTEKATKAAAQANAMLMMVPASVRSQLLRLTGGWTGVCGRSATVKKKSRRGSFYPRRREHRPEVARAKRELAQANIERR